MRALLPVLLLAACTPGPNEETLVDELRVIAAVAEPPEVLPGETTEVDAFVADPLARGAEGAMWLCTPTEDGCAEAGTPLAERLVVGPVVDGELRGSLTLNPLWAAFAGPEPIPAPVWVLACEPGLCPQLDQLADALVDGPDAAVEELLATPTEWIADLPIEGVSLGAKTLRVSTRAPEVRNTNPVLTVVAPTESAPGEELSIEVAIDDTEEITEVMGLATAGGFGGTAFSFLNGQAVMRWYAPEEPSSVELYAVVTDGLGGTAVWRGLTDVR